MKSLLYKNKLDIGVTHVLFKTGNELQSKPTLRTPHYYGLLVQPTNIYKKLTSLVRTQLYQLCAVNSTPMFTVLPRRGITKS